MGNKELITDEVKTQRLLDLYFATASKPGSPADERSGLHLDADTLTAFVESSLSTREAEPVVAHLVDCGFCRKTSAELIRLQYEFSVETAEQPASDRQTSKISEVLSGLLEKILGTSDATVFAHEEKGDEKEKTSAKETDKKE